MRLRCEYPRSLCSTHCVVVPSHFESRQSSRLNAHARIVCWEDKARSVGLPQSQYLDLSNPTPLAAAASWSCPARRVLCISPSSLWVALCQQRRICGVALPPNGGGVRRGCG